MRGLLTRRVGDGRMETAEVDEGVRAQEEIGDDGGNGVELSCSDPVGERGQSVCWATCQGAAWRPPSQLGDSRRAPEAQCVSTFPSVKWAHHFVKQRADVLFTVKGCLLTR